MRIPALVLPLFLAFLSACDTAPVLAPTPYVMLGDEGRQLYESLPDQLRTPEIPIMYFTDRVDEREPEADEPVYGAMRGDIVTYGVVTIAPEDKEMGWEEFVDLSTTPGSHEDVRLKVDDIDQCGTIWSTLSQLEIQDGQVVYPDSSVAAFLSNLEAFDRCMEPWLIEGDDNAAIVFVHGFNNTFEGASLRLAKTWHAIGRRGVPILFTWPAGFDAFKPIAYNHDRESGEFAVQSLKTLLLALAMNDRISRVHVVAHSRGVDVTTTAMREVEAEIAAAEGNTPFAQLSLGYDKDEFGERVGGQTPADVTKIETLTLVAADLDLDVFTQRFVAERAGRAAKRITIYTSARDKAITAADIFFASNLRLGKATMEDFDPRVRELVSALPSVDIIECRVKTKDSHLYLFEHPAALSDMVLAIRDHKYAGIQNGRPLERLAPGFWVLDEGYMRPEE
ncbi:MAG: alpha/beta hydrolase [Planctomycetota bacterium]